MDHEQQVRDAWRGLSGGDFEAVESVFAENAKWRAVEDGPWNCESRVQILDVLRDNRARGALDGDVEEVLEVGERVVVAFRPAQADPEGWPLDNGIRYVVLTIDDGLIAEMKGCLNREVALEYASAA